MCLSRLVLLCTQTSNIDYRAIENMLNRRTVVGLLAGSLAGCTGDVDDPTDAESTTTSARATGTSTASGTGTPTDPDDQTDTTTATDETTETPQPGTFENPMDVPGAVTLQRGLRVSVDQVALGRTLVTDDTDHTAPPREIWLCVRLREQNGTDSRVDAIYGQTVQVIADGTQHSPSGFLAGSQLGGAVTGERWENQETLLPDIEHTGWLIYRIPYAATSATVALIEDSYEHSTEQYWQTSIDPRQHPSLRLLGLDAPDKAAFGTEFDVTTRYRNAAAVDATTSVELDFNDDQIGSDSFSKQVTFPADSTTEVAFSFVADYIGEFTASIANRTVATSLTPHRVAVGEAVELPAGHRLRVTRVTRSDSITGTTSYGEQLSVEPEAADEFVIVTVRGRASPTDSFSPARTDRWSLDGASTADSYEVSRLDRLTDPVAGTISSLYGGQLDAGETAQWNVIYTATADANVGPVGYYHRTIGAGADTRGVLWEL